MSVPAHRLTANQTPRGLSKSSQPRCPRIESSDNFVALRFSGDLAKRADHLFRIIAPPNCIKCDRIVKCLSENASFDGFSAASRRLYRAKTRKNARRGSHAASFCSGRPVFYVARAQSLRSRSVDWYERAVLTVRQSREGIFGFVFPFFCPRFFCQRSYHSWTATPNSFDRACGS